MCLKWTQIIFMFAIEITLGQHFSIKNISISGKSEISDIM